MHVHIYRLMQISRYFCANMFTQFSVYPQIQLHVYECAQTHSFDLCSTCCWQHLNRTMCFTDPTKHSEVNVGVAFVGFSHLGPACLARRFPELQDCPDEPTTEPADIVATCGFSIWKRKNGCLLWDILLISTDLLEVIDNFQSSWSVCPSHSLMLLDWTRADVRHLNCSLIIVHSFSCEVMAAMTTV